MENSKDFFVATTTNRELANSLRHELVREFSHLWVCVIYNQDCYRVNVANNWGGRLPQEQETKISMFAQKYVDDNDEQNTDEEPCIVSVEDLKRVITQETE